MVQDPEEVATPQEEPISETETVEESPVKHSLYEKLKGYNPDEDYPDDGAAMTAAEKRLAEFEKYHEETEALLQNISDAVDADPEYAQLTAYIGKGMGFREAIARIIDPEDLQAIEGDPDYDALEAAKQQRMADREARGSRISEIENNSRTTAEQIDKYISENEINEEEADAIMGVVDKMVSDAVNGIISIETLSLARTALNHPKELAQATEDARTEALNENIEIQKAKTVTATSGDGIASVSGATVVPESKPLPKKDEIGNIVERSIKSRTF